jgi:predicted RNA-binding protein
MITLAISMEVLPFKSIRNDWYIGNSTLPRTILSCIAGEKDIILTDFYRQWIPVFEWYGVKWKGSIPPKTYMPIFSEMNEEKVCGLVDRAKKHNALRALVEATSVLDPIVSDLLYIVDNSIPLNNSHLAKDADFVSSNGSKRLLLNGWQSYGRPSVRSVEHEMMSVNPAQRIAAVLPCALRRPYGESRTHQRIYQKLRDKGYNLDKIHKVVLTSLGVLPEELWNLPQVLAYDAGVPDIYRILRLARAWFGKARYDLVIDCLQFRPYRDILQILQRESLIKDLHRVAVAGQRHFSIK